MILNFSDPFQKEFNSTFLTLQNCGWFSHGSHIFLLYVHFFIVFVWRKAHKGDLLNFLWHCLMECCISNTPTIGTSGISSLCIDTDPGFAEVVKWWFWSFIFFAITFNTSGVKTVEKRLLSTICTTRWLLHRFSANMIAPVFIYQCIRALPSEFPVLCVGIAASGCDLFTDNRSSGIPVFRQPPILSQSPFANTASLSESMSWYFSEKAIYY